MRRKICIVVHSRANYGRIKSVMSAVRDHPELELQLLVSSSAVLKRYGNVVEIIKSDGFTPNSMFYSMVEGSNPITMAKSTGLAVIELATNFDNIKPDVVLTVADRFETMATAIAASYMNIPLAHTQGGEVTGSIDDSVRHAITKLSHIHFPATERSKEYIIRMGEDPETVYLTGCPSIDLLVNLDLSLPTDIFSKYRGVGSDLNPKNPYIVVLQHPVTTEYGDGILQIKETLKAVNKISSKNLQVAWLWPNIDAGSDDISKGIRAFRELNTVDDIHFFINFEPEDYVRLIKNSKCIVGNSSSGLREGAYLGIPCVNIGNRQKGRERAKNVIDVGYDEVGIQSAILEQVKNGSYESSKLVGDGSAGEKIANILAAVEIKINKTLGYTVDTKLI